MFKFTNSRDGRKRANLRLEYRFGLDDIVTTIQRSVGYGTSEDLPTTRKQAEEMVRKELWHYGLQEHSDDIYEPHAEVEALIIKLFPELAEGGEQS